MGLQALCGLLCHLLLTLQLVTAATKTRCLPSGTDVEINAAFKTGGKGATVALCPGSIHRLNGTVYFTNSRQTLTTEGNPLGRGRALLIVEGEYQAIAVQADCPQCSSATIRSLEIDGNRPLLLRVPLGGALIETGNGEGQIVRDCRLYEPRGWSALHFREGDRKQCRAGKVINNEIVSGLEPSVNVLTYKGPCGEEWDDDYDGEVEAATLPHGNPRADGISLACQDSLVERNVVYDTTDGAIVLFGSAGTEVRNNDIYARTRVVLGGINLVDYPPWKGDYFGVTVHHNNLHAEGRYLVGGILIGPSSWSDDTESIVHSATVTDNVLSGPRFGYGIVVSSAEKFTVLRNVADEAKFSGIYGPRCPRAPHNGRPTAFLINRGSAQGTFQEEFVNGEVQHIICILPSPEFGVDYKPFRFRDSPLWIEAKAKAAAESDQSEEAWTGPVNFDARLAEALVNYQMTLLAVMDAINDKTERANTPSDEELFEAPKAKSKDRTKTGHPEVDGMSGKLNGLDRGEQQLRTQFDSLKSQFDDVSNRVKRTFEDSKPVLEDVFRSVQKLKASPQAAPMLTMGERETLVEEPEIDAPHSSLVGPLVMVSGSGLAVYLAWRALKRMRNKRWHSRQPSRKDF